MKARAATLAVAIYLAITAFLGRDVLSAPGAVVAGDEGDPLLVSALLRWNATVPPLSDGWWQFPIFHPTPDTLAFSEHVLGMSPLSTPIHWITGNPVVTYNLVMMLTFPLCGLAMYALVRRLTGSAAAAFVAGIAFAFAPYRASQLPHLQMLASFWAPLGLLGLHAYLETGARRWLVLYGAAWLLQGASNGYALVFFSVLVGLWVLWFVVAARRWRDLAAIAATTILAALPLLPIIVKYTSVHALHGFTRDAWEVGLYSADLAAVFCASRHLELWSWIHTACRPEGELFPGIGIVVLGMAALVGLIAAPSREKTRYGPLAIASGLLLAVGLVYAAITVTVMIGGPWAVRLGPLRVSASSIAKPVMIATGASLLGVLLSPAIRRAALRSSAPGFYTVAALLTWVLALGPVITFMGQPRGYEGPFALLMHLPGVEGLRVPARFWLMTTMCLAVMAGHLVASFTAGRGRAAKAAIVTLAAGLLLADGWIGKIPTAPVPAPVPDARALQGATVLSVPMDILRDIAAEFRAVNGGWHAVNGYSGYFPSYYPALSDGSREEDEGILLPFLERGDLHVLVEEAAPRLVQIVERQPGAVVVARGAGTIQYRIPARDAIPAWNVHGQPQPIRSVRASCNPPEATLAIDRDPVTRWECGAQQPWHEITLDLGEARPVAAVVQDLAEYHGHFPRHLVIETSLDGGAWDAAWEGSVRALLIAQAMANPGPRVRFAVPFAGRQARYVRLRQTGQHERLPWSVAELEIY